MGRLLTVTKDGVLTEEYGYDDFGRRGWRLGSDLANTLNFKENRSEKVRFQLLNRHFRI